jgi:DNA-binding NtrC family response regulator
MARVDASLSLWRTKVIHILRRGNSAPDNGQPPGATEANGTSEEPAATLTPVLLVSPNDSDHELLSKALEGTRWRLLHAHSCIEAVPILAAERFPVIIRDLECCDLGCVHAIRCTQVGAYPAPLIVAAPAPDFRLWEDVIDRGGLEVLPKPFEPAKVLKILEFAHKHWLAGEFRRSWERFDFPE